VVQREGLITAYNNSSVAKYDLSQDESIMNMSDRVQAVLDRLVKSVQETLKVADKYLSSRVIPWEASEVVKELRKTMDMAFNSIDCVNCILLAQNSCISKVEKSRQMAENHAHDDMNYGTFGSFRKDDKHESWAEFLLCFD
jgi:hypothetical protein